MSGYIPPPHGAPDTGLIPELVKKVEKEKHDSVLYQLYEALESVVKFVYYGVKSMFELLIKVFSGDAYHIFGLAPYLTLPALAMFPLQATFPGTIEFLTAPLTFIGVSQTAITSYQFFGGIYWLLLAIYNFYMGQAITQNS